VARVAATKVRMGDGSIFKGTSKRPVDVGRKIYYES
jgi:hypothetical protein